MAAQPFRSVCASLLFDGLKHFGEIHRIITGSRKNLRSEKVGLSFVLPAELEEIRSQSDLCALSDDIAGIPANHGAENGAADRTQLDAGALRLCSLGGSMSKGDVAELVRHHTGHLAFRVRCFDHSAVDEHRATGKG